MLAQVDRWPAAQVAAESLEPSAIVTEMDMNAVELAMQADQPQRQSLFAGCDEGAENWALLASLIETSKLNGVNAEHWLSDVLAKLVNGWPAARPWASTLHDA
jgi:transposase